ncbi:hypothetical protein [Sphingomonas sp. CARO-RG-8B-R24-01]|uniref:hypothetical protein n=1 Tax=Sphingomonas sp. CARO-RG-8B-R24-01 TaxID=2914831 RepID=UPI001F55FCF7|nr:hypothetical protein [Sphingomonas sp. CARO-RG-8B-R24-01]
MVPLRPSSAHLSVVSATTCTSGLSVAPDKAAMSVTFSAADAADATDAGVATVATVAPVMAD